MNTILRKLRRIVIFNVSTSETFSIFSLYNAPHKYTAQLIPEIETKLQNEEMKHRQQPGIRKFPVVKLPEWLLNAVSNLFTLHYEYDEKVLAETATKLKQHLFSRRLPIEQDEINKRTLDELKKLKVNIDTMHEDDHTTQKYLNTVKQHLKSELLRWKPVEYNSHLSQTYLYVRLAANYACVSHVFSEISTLIPSFKPKSFFDFGSGVGSATWAAHTHFKDSIKEYLCIDASADMNFISEMILKGGDPEKEEPVFKDVYFRQFLPTSSKQKYDLVISAFSMMELPSLKDRLQAIDILWQKTSDMLVIIENGGRAGFSTVMDARDYILKIEDESEKSFTTGAYVVAPCPHEYLCPMFRGTKDSKQLPCQFSTEYYSPYPKKDQNIKQKDVFSFVVLRRGKKSEAEGYTNWPRIVKPVIKAPRKVFTRLCCNDGILYELILTKKKHGRNTYRCARCSSRGDMLPVSVFPATIISGNDMTVNGDHDIEAFDDKESYDEDNEKFSDKELNYLNK